MNLELATTLVFFLSGGFLIFLAITVVRDNFNSRLNRLMGTLLFFAGLGPLVLGLQTIIVQAGPGRAGLSESPLYNLYLAWELFFPVLVVFSWYFPVDRLSEFRFQRLRYAVFVPQIMHVLLVMFFADIISFLDMMSVESGEPGLLSVVLKPISLLVSFIGVGISFLREYDRVIFGLLNLGYVGIALYFLESGRLSLSNPRLVSQFRHVMWSFRLGLGLFSLATLGYIFFPGRFSGGAYTGLVIASLVVGSGLLAYAIIRHQFLDVRLAFRQSLINTFISAVLVGIYVFVAMRSQTMLEPVFGERAQTVSYAFIILILLLFYPINNWIDRIVRSMFMRTRTDYRNIIERFSREIISMFDPRQLRLAIEETMKTALLVERVYFVLYDDSISEYAVIQSEDYPRRTVVDREDLLLRGINLLDSPIDYHSLADYTDGSQLAGILSELRVRIVMPMKDATHLLGFVALSERAAGYRYTPEEYNLLGVLSNQMVSALTNARLYVESLERTRLQEEVTMARQIQLDLLPSNPPDLDFVTISACSNPSRTVGGDFYDFILLPERNRVGVVIADASGKGMPAALMIAQIQAIIRSEINNGTSIANMLKNMNKQVAAATSSEKYVTLFYAELDYATGTMYYANAGHNYPLLVHANGEMELLETGGPIIGAFPLMDYTSTSVSLQKDDLVFLFTDGLSEAMDESGREYTEQRVREFIRECRGCDPQTVIDRILEDVQTFDPTIPPKDDTTIIALKVRQNGFGQDG